MKKLHALLFAMMLMSVSLTGCIGDEDEDEELSVIGNYTADTIGTATANNDDILLEITLVSSDVPIKFAGSDEHNQCQNTQDPGDCTEWFGFELGVGCKHDNYKVGYYSHPGDESQRYEATCIIIEDVVDEIWSVGETIVLKENVNESGVCDAPCTLELTINNGNRPRDYISTDNETKSIEYSIN